MPAPGNDILQHTSNNMLSMLLTLQERIRQKDVLMFNIYGDLVGFLLYLLLSLKELADDLA